MGPTLLLRPWTFKFQISGANKLSEGRLVGSTRCTRCGGAGSFVESLGLA